MSLSPRINLYSGNYDEDTISNHIVDCYLFHGWCRIRHWQGIWGMYWTELDNHVQKFPNLTITNIAIDFCSNIWMICSISAGCHEKTNWNVMQSRLGDRYILSLIIIVSNVIFSFQDLVVFVHRQAKIVEEQSRTIEQQATTNEKQSALIEVGIVYCTNKTSTAWSFEK